MSSVVRERRKKVGKKTVKSYEVIENNGTPEGQVHATCDSRPSAGIIATLLNRFCNRQKGRFDPAYGEEITIAAGGDFEVRIDSCPEPDSEHSSYVRVVRLSDLSEIVYWNSDEWEESPTEVLMAILGVIMKVSGGENVEV